VARARAVLDAHGVVAVPTETYYGLAVSVFDHEACARVFEIKGREATKALPCIVSGIEQLASVVSEISPLANELASRFWPGPLTLIMPARASVAAASTDATATATVAVRVSSLPLARELAAIAGPITATSANVSGASPATTADEVIAQLGDALDLVLDGGATLGGPASTIVDVTGATPVLVRGGAIAFRSIVSP
jgi:L-threonylcarbamoyladenylate synthase